MLNLEYFTPRIGLPMLAIVIYLNKHEMKEGSKWRKWNFHVHTKGTNKNDQFTSSSMDNFFYTFYKKAFQNKICAIGITDYFSIERYLDALDYRIDIQNKVNAEGEKLFENEEMEFIKNIFVFPNVELRMLPATAKANKNRKGVSHLKVYC